MHKHTYIQTLTHNIHLYTQIYTTHALINYSRHRHTHTQQNIAHLHTLTNTRTKHMYTCTQKYRNYLNRLALRLAATLNIALNNIHNCIIRGAVTTAPSVKTQCKQLESGNVEKRTFDARYVANDPSIFLHTTDNIRILQVRSIILYYLCLHTQHAFCSCSWALG